MLNSPSDLVALQYASGFADVFDRALPRLRASIARGWPIESAIIDAYLDFLAQRPDTLIARKRGEATAIEMAKSDPANLEWQHDISIGHIEVGDAEGSLGDIKAAAEAYLEAATIDAVPTNSRPCPRCTATCSKVSPCAFIVWFRTSSEPRIPWLPCKLAKVTPSLSLVMSAPRLLDVAARFSSGLIRLSK